MAATTIAISSRISIDDLERMARDRIERHGGAMFYAATRNRRQVRQLRRLWHRMGYLRDEGGGCILGEPGPRTTLFVWAAGRLHDGWFLPEDDYQKID